MPLRVEAIVVCALLASCATGPPPRSGPASGTIKLGKPYRVAGVTYTPADDRRFDETGLASWYGNELRGRSTANGEAFDPDGMTAAHRTLPMPSWVSVTALDTGRAIVVRINDRGPFTSDRVIDLSFGAARALGITGRGAHRVRVRRVATPGASPVSTSLPRVETSARIPAGEGPWFVQVASFTSASRADALADRLGARVSQGGGVYRVRLGPFDRADRARDALARLAATGYPDVVVTR